MAFVWAVPVETVVDAPSILNHESSRISTDFYTKNKIRTGISLVVGDIEGKQETGRSRQHDAYYNDNLWKVCIIVVVRMLVIDQ